MTNRAPLKIARRQEKAKDMARNKPSGKKLRLIARGKRRPSPRWADIRKFGLKRARTRRIRVSTKNWRRQKLKI